MIFYCSHVLEVLEKVCSSVLILSKGRIVAHDTLEQLRDKMHEPSLAGIFAQLTREENHPAVANRIVEAMRA